MRGYLSTEEYPLLTTMHQVKEGSRQHKIGSSLEFSLHVATWLCKQRKVKRIEVIAFRMFAYDHVVVVLDRSPTSQLNNIDSWSDPRNGGAVICDSFLGIVFPAKNWRENLRLCRGIRPQSSVYSNKYEFAEKYKGYFTYAIKYTSHDIQQYSISILRFKIRSALCAAGLYPSAPVPLGVPTQFPCYDKYENRLCKVASLEELIKLNREIALTLASEECHNLAEFNRRRDFEKRLMRLFEKFEYGAA
jgi:hypothetical protein